MLPHPCNKGGHDAPRPLDEGRHDRAKPKSFFSLKVKVVRYLCVDAFPECQTLNKNRGGALCTGRTVRGLVRGAVVLSAQGRTVRGLGPDGPRPDARLGLLCLTAGRSAP
jgi:hypothetical protein